jgi:hypothetical protein
MKKRLTLPLHLVLGLLVGTALSFISVRAFPPVERTTLSPPTVVSPTLVPLPTQTGTPAPYVTLAGVWLVRVQFSSSARPQVLKATYLEQGRITPFDQGDYRLEILSPTGDVLFSGAFEVDFLQGDPPRAVEKLTTILIVPDIDQAVRIRLKAPQGETTYDLEH